MPEADITGTSCTHCGHAFERVASITDPNATPDDGAVSVCIRCGGVDLFAHTPDGKLTLVRPTPEREAELLRNPDVADVVTRVLTTNAGLNRTPSVAATFEELQQVASQVDPMLSPCPRCQGQMRGEYKPMLAPISEVAHTLGVTPDQIRATGALPDPFGRIKIAVPYVTCMLCGHHANAAIEPA